MADIKWSAFPVAGGATISGVGLQSGLNVQFPMGTAALKNTGTSGGNVPLLNTVNSWSAQQAFNAGAIVDTLAVSDLNFALSIVSSGNRPMILWDTGDYQIYDRAGNYYAWFGAGAEKMRLDAAGNVGIGTTTPQAILDITRSVDGSNHTLLLNTDAGNNGVAQHIVGNGTHSAALAFFSANGTSLASPLWHADGSSLYAGGNGGLSVCTRVAAPLYFGTNDIERMRIDAAGYVKASNTGTYIGIASAYHEIVSSVSDIALRVTNSNATPWGQIIQFSGAAPNTSGQFFLGCIDTVGVKCQILGNGGLSNYAANNVNLSDANVKDQITPYSKTELAALEQSFTNVIWGKFKYRDQTHDDWNHGPTAQGVERAFEKTAPELVDESDLGTAPKSGKKHKVVYENDLNHISHALLADALMRIKALEAQIAAGKR